MASIQDNGGYLCKTTVNTSDDCVEILAELLLVGIASFLALKRNKKMASSPWLIAWGTSKKCGLVSGTQWCCVLSNYSLYSELSLRCTPLRPALAVWGVYLVELHVIFKQTWNSAGQDQTTKRDVRLWGELSVIWTNMLIFKDIAHIVIAIALQCNPSILFP